MRLGEAWVEMLLRDAKYKRDLKSVEKQTNMAVSRMASSFKRLGGAIAGAFAVYKVVNFVRSSLDAYAKQERAERELTEAMKHRGVYTQQAFEHLKDYASALQKASVFGDEQILVVQRMLVQFGAEGKMLDQLTKATIDLATAKRMDLTAAADLVAKAIGSSTNALSRYGIVVEGAAGSTERAASLVKNTEKIFGGSARAALNTYEGAIRQISMAWGDMKEKLAAPLADIIRQISPSIVEIAERMGKWLEENKELTKSRILETLHAIEITFKGIAAAIRDIKAAWDAARAVWNWLDRTLPKNPVPLPGYKPPAQWSGSVGYFHSGEAKAPPRIAITVHPGGIAWGNKTFPGNLSMPTEPVLGRTYGLPDVAAMMAGTKLGLQGQMGPLDQLEKSLELVSSQRKASEMALIVDTRKTMDAMVALTERTAEAMQQNFSDLFFDAMKGKFKDLGDYATAFLNSFERALADVMGQFMTQKLFGKEMKGGGLVDKAVAKFVDFFGAKKAGAKKQAAGGIIPEPVFGIGASGQTYTFGENGPETVVPGVRGLQSGAGSVVNITINAVDASSFADLAKRNPGAIVAPVMEALNQGNLGLRNSIRRVV